MRYETPSGREVPELVIDSSPDASGRGRKVALRLRYNGTEERMTKLIASPGLRILDQRDNRVNRISFTVEVALTGVAERTCYVIAEYDGKVLGSMHNLDETLRVRLGKVKLHADFESDLFAQMLGMSSDADRLLAYWRVLAAKNNVELPRFEWEQLNDNPLKQNTGKDESKWNCGGALMTFGQRYVPRNYTSGATIYYNRPAPHKLSQVVFNKAVVKAGAERMRKQLRNGNFIQCFVGHHEDLRVEKGVIKESNNTHYITLFGCSTDGKQFIFFDPWPTGSVLMYQSGVLGTVKSLFMGVIEFFEDEGKIRSPDNASGGHKYVILQGL